MQSRLLNSIIELVPFENLPQLLFILFTLAITGFAIYANQRVIDPIAQQLGACGFQPIPATIKSTGVREVFAHGGRRSGSGKWHFEPTVTYSYSVAGTEFEGDTIRVNPPWFREQELARDWLSSLPTGGTLTAYCDPTQPQRSVLQTGLNGTDLAPLFVIIFFNIIVLALWRIAVIHAIALVQRLPPCGFFVVRSASRRRLKQWYFSPTACALLAGGFISFIVLTFIAITDGDLEARLSAPLRTCIIGLWLIASAMLSAMAWRGIFVWPGRKDIIIDDAENLLVLPQRSGASRVTVPYRQVTSFDVEKQRQFRRLSWPFVFGVIMQWRNTDGTIDAQTIFRCATKTSAETSRNWMSDKIVR